MKIFNKETCNIPKSPTPRITININGGNIMLNGDSCKLLDIPYPNKYIVLIVDEESEKYYIRSTSSSHGYAVSISGYSGMCHAPSLVRLFMETIYHHHSIPRDRNLVRFNVDQSTCIFADGTSGNELIWEAK